MIDDMLISMIDTIEQSNLGAGNADDRPAWIPAEIKSDWDESAYAYQTEAELMPQGPLHAILNTLISEVLVPHLSKFGAMLWMDLFLLYRDSKGLKHRIGPDWILALPNQDLAGSSWDLDQMPVPELVIEITSPESRDADFEKNRKLYHQLGIKTYLLIDGLNEQGEVTNLIQSHVWKNGQKLKPNADGFLKIPDLNIDVKAEATALQFFDPITTHPLLRQVEKDQALEEKDRLIEQLKRSLEKAKEQGR